MQFESFLEFIERKDYGIAAFNTYRQDKKSHFYIMIAQKGDKGRFLKEEGETSTLYVHLETIVKRLLYLESGRSP